MRLIFLLGWFGFMASTPLWLPAYEGDLGGEADGLIPLYAVVGGLVAIGVRDRERSTRRALLSTLPVVGVLAMAVATGLLWNDDETYRGGPLYLYYGIALLSSWAALVLSTALVSRTKWNGGWGICAGCMVALLGLLLVSAQID